jgi:uncharacterized protein (DUF2141 family)
MRRPIRHTALFIGLLASAAVSAPVSAATVTVTVDNVHNDHGHVLVALCTPPQFLSPHCTYAASTAARTGSVSLKLDGVRPGRYAAQAFHDANDNKVLDRNFFGMPTEGMGFSNNPGFHFGPPRFEEAAVQITDPATSVTMALRYFP